MSDTIASVYMAPALNRAGRRGGKTRKLPKQQHADKAMIHAMIRQKFTR